MTPGSQHEPKADAQLTEPPRRPPSFLFLSNLYTWHGAWTYNLKTKHCRFYRLSQPGTTSFRILVSNTGCQMTTKTRSSKTAMIFQLRIPCSSKCLIKCKGRIRTLFFFKVSSIPSVGFERTILWSRVAGSTNRASQVPQGQFYLEATFRQTGLSVGR